MDLNEQARVAHDQMQINRVAQAVVTVALEKGGRVARRVAAEPGPAAQRAIRVLVTCDDGWLADDAELRNAVRQYWSVIRP